MTPADDAPIPELTPEEKAKVYAHFAKQFTVEKLIEYIENDEPMFSAEEVLASVEAIERHYAEPPASEAA